MERSQAVFIVVCVYTTLVMENVDPRTVFFSGERPQLDPYLGPISFSSMARLVSGYTRLVSG